MPKPAATKTAETHPFMVQKPYTHARLYRGWKDAQAAIRKDLLGLRDDFRLLYASDAIELIDALVKEVNCLPPEQGGTVDGLVDPVSGIRYKATLVKRTQL